MTSDQRSDEMPRGREVRFQPLTPDIALMPDFTCGPQFMVFADQDGLAKTFCRTAIQHASLPAIDFNKHYLVLVHQGVCPTGGYGVRVLGVRKTSGHVAISVEFKEPKPGDAVTLAMTAPYVFFLVPRGPREADPTFSFWSGGQKLAERKPIYGREIT